MVQAIHGFTLGFRRGDSVTSKSREKGKIVCSGAVGDSDSCCVRTVILRLCSFALHTNTVLIWSASVALGLLRRLRLCVGGYNSTS